MSKKNITIGNSYSTKNRKNKSENGQMIKIHNVDYETDTVYATKVSNGQQFICRVKHVMA